MGRGSAETGAEVAFDFSDICRTGISDLSLMSEREEWIEGVTDALNGSIVYGDWRPTERLLDKAKFRGAMLDGKAGGDTQELAQQIVYHSYYAAGAESINEFYQRFYIPAGLEPGHSWLLGEDEKNVIHLYASADPDAEPLGVGCTDIQLRRPAPRGSAFDKNLVCLSCEDEAVSRGSDELNDAMIEGAHYAVTDPKTDAADRVAAVAALHAYMSAHREPEEAGFTARACKELHEQLLSMAARAVAERFVATGNIPTELAHKLFFFTGSDEKLLADLKEIAFSRKAASTFEDLASNATFVSIAILAANREGQESDLDLARGRFLGCFFGDPGLAPSVRSLVADRVANEKSAFAVGLRQTLDA